MSDLCTDRGFIVMPNGRVEEIDEDDRTYTWSAPGLYDELAFAGYARSSDVEMPTFDGCIDLRTDGETVTVFTTGPAPREHVLPAAVAEVFLRWYRDYAEGADQ